MRVDTGIGKRCSARQLGDANRMTRGNRRSIDSPYREQSLSA